MSSRPSCKFSYSWAAGKSQFKFDFVVSLDQWQNLSEVTTPEQILDQHIAGFFRALRDLGLPAAVVRARLADWLVAPPPDHLLLIESDPKFRRYCSQKFEE